MASARAISNQKKTAIAVKRCMNASKPRAFVRSNKASEPLLSKTLLLGFFCGCIKIAITIMTDKTSNTVNSKLYMIFSTKNIENDAARKVINSSTLLSHFQTGSIPFLHYGLNHFNIVCPKIQHVRSLFALWDNTLVPEFYQDG